VITLHRVTLLLRLYLRHGNISANCYSGTLCMVLSLQFAQFYVVQ